MIAAQFPRFISKWGPLPLPFRESYQEVVLLIEETPGDHHRLDAWIPQTELGFQLQYLLMDQNPTKDIWFSHLFIGF